MRKATDRAKRTADRRNRSRTVSIDRLLAWRKTAVFAHRADLARIAKVLDRARVRGRERAPATALALKARGSVKGFGAGIGRFRIFRNQDCAGLRQLNRRITFWEA